MGVGGTKLEKIVHFNNETKIIYPLNFNKFTDTIYGGGYPVLIKHFEMLKSLGIETIITLTTERFHTGRVINHITENEAMEDNWVLSMQPEFIDLPEFPAWIYETFTFVHIPLADGFYPTYNDIEKFTETVTLHPGKIYVHCWTGKGRTTVMVSSYLLYNNIYTYQNLCTVYNLKNLSVQQRGFINMWREKPSDLYNLSNCLKTPRLEIRTPKDAQSMTVPIEIEDQDVFIKRLLN